MICSTTCKTPIKKKTLQINTTINPLNSIKMKKFILAFASVMTALYSCTNDDLTPNPDEKPEPATLTVNIVSDNPTKAQGDLHGNQTDDNTVNTLELFVFRTEGTDAGMLDAYLKLENDQLKLSDIEIKTTTGAKIIYAIANSHRDEWSGINTLDAFQAQLSSLKDENIRDFTMTGSVEATVQTTTAVTFSISRLVARVQLASIKTDFAGTPWEGSTLSNVKMYLVNVSSDKLYASGTDSQTPGILNKGALVAEDVNTCTMTYMLYDQIPSAIDDMGYSNTHYYYCYENAIEEETDDKQFTRLVVQADLNGHTYYYPIDINQEGYGYVASNGHKGIKRNTIYTINLTITRPGSLDPNEPVEYGTLTVNLNVLDWTTTPVANVIL